MPAIQHRFTNFFIIKTIPYSFIFLYTSLQMKQPNADNQGNNLSIFNIFGPSPFAPLQEHMKQVSACVEKVPTIFAALEKQELNDVAKLAEEIEQLEYVADQTRNHIRNHLPTGIFLPVDRFYLLEVLACQDFLADKAEDISVLLRLKPLSLLEALKNDFHAFLDKNIESVKQVHRIIQELDELVHSSFGGAEAKRVNDMVAKVALCEHEADLLQRKLLKTIFQLEGELSHGTFQLWLHIFQEVGALSNLAEKLANLIRMMLEL
ncbi:MAG: hypothetical protein K0S74_777 [Chlamydiales bacterium]|jgi:predicted phosphate transport protein (TIGR00153 family)|nr:hypothetical protein [Chlamydiales bacterium]